MCGPLRRCNALDQTQRFTCDLVGNRLALALDRGNNGTNDETVSSTYDGNDRLLTESRDLASGTDTTTTYSWGGTGNPTTTLTGKTVRETATNKLIQTTTNLYSRQGLSRVVILIYNATGTAVGVEVFPRAYDGR